MNWHVINILGILNYIYRLASNKYLTKYNLISIMLVNARKGDMNKLILCHKSGLECLREFRYQKQDSRIAKEATKVLLSKKRHGNQVFDVLVDSQNKKHNN